ncbi:MAG: hypothetical protein WBE79_16530 [Candidatus Cybelea sp.]
MRAAYAVASSTFSLIATVAIAGCGGAQPTQPVALDPTSAQIAALKEGKSPSRLLELQLEGRLPAPIPPDALRRGLQRRERARPQLVFHAGATVALWAANTNFNYLLGQDATGGKTVTAIDLSQNSCYSPVALKVDRAQNVWVGCELTSLSGTNGAVQEYSGAGMLRARYLPACPTPVSHCQSFSGYGYDSGVDSHGNVFASLNLYDIQICNPSCVDTLSAGFEWWPKGKPSATPRLISTGANCSPVCGVGFTDVDASGNLWFTVSGYDESSTFGFGLGEVTNPTKNPHFTLVEPIGTYGFFGGVYLSGGGKTLNVIDQKARTISQYHLPLSPSGAPFNVLGPTRQNAFGVGDPVSGGFNQAETKLAIGDTGGWLDIGKVSTNRWSVASNFNFYSGIEGAAFTPSDK